jgi:hypothetical protein
MFFAQFLISNDKYEYVAACHHKNSILQERYQEGIFDASLFILARSKNTQ